MIFIIFLFLYFNFYISFFTYSLTSKNNEVKSTNQIVKEYVDIMSSLKSDIFLDIDLDRYKDRVFINGNTFLMMAIIAGNVKIVKKLIDKGVDLKIKNYDGDDIFSIAVKYNQKNIIGLLINISDEYEYRYKLKFKEILNNSFKQIGRF